MRELSIDEIEAVFGAVSYENACVVGSSVAGGLIGGVVGAYGTLGFGVGVGASWGSTVGNWAGTAFCGRFFSQDEIW